MDSGTENIIAEIKTYWSLSAIKLDRRISEEYMQNKAQRNNLY